MSEIKQAFEELGVDTSGLISLDDVARALVHMGLAGDVDEAHEFIARQFETGAVPPPIEVH